MSRSVDVCNNGQPSNGYDMVGQTAKVFAHPSLASGVTTSGLANGSAVAGSPGASLGTGSNVDIYTPGIEAV